MARRKKPSVKSTVRKGKKKPDFVKGTRKDAKAIKHTTQKFFEPSRLETPEQRAEFVSDKSSYFRVSGGIGKKGVTTQLKEKYMRGDKPSYNTQSVRESIAPEDLSKEYTRLRSIAMKRLSSLEKAGFKYTQTYKQAKKELKRIDQMSKRHREDRLIQGIVAANRFLSNEESTVRGMKTQANQWIETMREKGYDVNKANYQTVISALNYLSDIYGNLIYDSDQAIEIAIDEVYEKVGEKGINSLIKAHSKSVRDEVLGDIYEKYSYRVAGRAEINKIVSQYFK